MSVISDKPAERCKAIELLLMQKFSAMTASKNENDRKVVEEAQRRLEMFRSEEVLNILYKLQSTETYYSKFIKQEIKTYKSK